jgi:hypothetical protein
LNLQLDRAIAPNIPSNKEHELCDHINRLRDFGARAIVL